MPLNPFRNGTLPFDNYHPDRFQAQNPASELKNDLISASSIIDATLSRTAHADRRIDHAPTMRASSNVLRLKQPDSLINRLPATMSAMLKDWLHDIANIAALPATEHPDYGLDDDSENTCFIHTGMQLLRKKLTSSAPSVTDIKGQVEALICHNAAAIEVSPEQYCDLLNMDKAGQLKALRSFHKVDEGQVKERVASKIASAVHGLHAVFGPNTERLTPEEQAFILDEIEEAVDGLISGHSARATLYTLGNKSDIKDAVLAVLNDIPDYRSSEENKTLNRLAYFDAELRKLICLNNVLTVLAGPHLPQNAKSYLLNAIADNVELLNVAEVGEQGDAGEFCAKIAELYYQHIGTLNTNSREVIQNRYTGLTNRIAYWAQQDNDTGITSQDISANISAPMSAISKSLEDNNTSLTLQHILDTRFAPESHPSSTIDGVAQFSKAMRMGLQRSIGL